MYKWQLAKAVEWRFVHCFQIKLDFKIGGFVEGEKLENRRKQLSNQEQEPTTNSTRNRTPGPGFESGPSAALTTTPFLQRFQNYTKYAKILKD